MSDDYSSPSAALGKFKSESEYLVDDRAAIVKGLRDMAMFFESNTEVPLPSHISVYVHMWNGYWGEDSEKIRQSNELLKERLTKVAKALKVFEKIHTDYNFKLKKKFSEKVTLEVSTVKESICTKRVVGTKLQEVEVYPTDIKPAKVTKLVDIVEWDCPPSLLS